MGYKSHYPKTTQRSLEARSAKLEERKRMTEQVQQGSGSEPAADPPTFGAPAFTKACPACAEQVAEAARVCRFCGYAFDPDFARANPRFVRLDGPLPRARLFTRRWLLVRVLLPLLIIGLIMTFVVSLLLGSLHKAAPKAMYAAPATAIVLVVSSPRIG